MDHKRIERHIDDRITKMFYDDYTIDEVKSKLIDNIVKFSQRDSYMTVSKFKLLSEWKKVPVKNKYTTYYVMHSMKRLRDIDWLISKKNTFKKIDSKKLFSIIQFKEKIK